MYAPKRRSFIGERIALGLLVLWVAACSSQKLSVKPKEFDSQDEAGSSHVAVVSVARWEDYAGALQPKFSLGEKEALERVLPSTRGLQEQIVDALRVLVKVAPPQSITQTTEGIKVTERQPGDLSAVADPASAAGDRTAASTPVSDAALKAPLGVDPMLQHVAATALFQEVQLLSRYVRDGASRECFAPYVVRLQVAQLPSARHEPYDEYVNVAFFDEGKGSTEAVPASTCSTPGRCERDPRVRPLPQVVPLLVTDNIEATTHAKSVDEVRQFGLALLMMIKGFGVSGSVDKFDEELQSVLGRDYNSLLTVTRMTDNTLRVRLGAAQQVGGNYSMIPRTHSITVLLLVPCPSGEVPKRRLISVSTDTELVHAESGRSLQRRSNRALNAELSAIATRFRLPTWDASPGDQRERVAAIVNTTDCEDFRAALLAAYGNRWASCVSCTMVDGRASGDLAGTIRACDENAKPIRLDPADYLRGLYDLVPQANYVAFQAALVLVGAPSGSSTFLWTSLANLTVGNNFNSASFELPALIPPRWFPAQTAIVVDDKKSRSSVILRGARGLQPDLLSAVLHVGGHELPAESVTALPNAHDFRFVFPSLADLGIKKPTDLSVTVAYDNAAATCPQLELCEPVWTSRGGHYLAKDGGADPEVPSFVLRSGAQVIRATKSGTGQVDVTLGVDPAGAAKGTKVTVVGATVESVTQAGQPTVSHPGVEFAVQVGSLVLGLRNLSPDRTVTISASNGKAPLSFPVVVESGS